MQTNCFVPFPEMNTERLMLRQLELADDEAISVLRSDESVNRFIKRPSHTSVEEARMFISKMNAGLSQGKWLYWAICLKDRPGLIGTICLWNFTDDGTTAEIGYELATVYHRMGLMKEAVKRIIDYSFVKMDINTLEAFTHKDNEASRHLLLKCGFKPTDRKDSENAGYEIWVLERKIA
jgi:ribosomal-protein-alanine N-acetyltransferase